MSSSDKQADDRSVAQLRLDAATLRMRAARRLAMGDVMVAADLQVQALKLEALADAERSHGSESQ